MKVVPLTVKPGAYMESQSGLQRGKPQIFCRYEEPANWGRKIAFVVAHPTSNFHDHYLIEPLAARGAGVLAVNTRYVGNDSMLIMERAVQDLGAGFRFLRAQGFERIVLIGNSGGGSLAALYQQQAEKPTILTTPDGQPFVYADDDLYAADAVALIAAHPGRATQLLAKIDPSVINDEDPNRIDANLDMFEPANGPPYDESWLKTYRLAQAARLDRITARVLSRLSLLESRLSPDVADEAFIIHRTQADPRNLDILLDANDRKQGTLGGEAASYNQAANGLARYCTLRSYLSQWSPRHTRAHGPRCLADCRVPVFIADFTADQTVFPSHVAEWLNAAESRGEYWRLTGAPHYLIGRPDMIGRTADALMTWARAIS